MNEDVRYMCQVFEGNANFIAGVICHEGLSEEEIKLLLFKQFKHCAQEQKKVDAKIAVSFLGEEHMHEYLAAEISQAILKCDEVITLKPLE